MYTLNQIPSEAQIRKYLRRILFGKNLFCPECRSRKVAVQAGRYRCRACRIRFTLTSHTWLANLKLPLQIWWLLLWCWSCEVPVKQTEALTGLTTVSVRKWFDTFREHLPQETHILERIVQLDEAYFKNMTLLMAKQKGTRNLAYLDRWGRYLPRYRQVVAG